MSYFFVDVEADGPIPGDYSMVCFGAVMLSSDLSLTKTFYGETEPISDNWDPEALAISGFTREQHEQFPQPIVTMAQFKDWVLKSNEKYRPIFVADNNGFDYMFTHWYFEHYLGPKQDPFGWSSRNLSDIYHGMKKNMRASFKHLRKTSHDHNPVNDAMGNAEAFVTMMRREGLKLI